MKKFLLGILFLIPSHLYADSISTGTVGFVLPSTNTVDPVKSWAVKNNDNWQKADTAIKALGSGGGGSGGSDNLGSHIATRPVSMPFGFEASSGVVKSSFTAFGPIISTSGFQGGGSTFTKVALNYGTADNPSITFGPNPNRGFFSASAGYPSIADSGATMFNFDSSVGFQSFFTQILGKNFTSFNAPAYSFNSFTNEGMANDSSQNLYLVVNGKNRIRLGLDGREIFNNPSMPAWGSVQISTGENVSNEPILVVGSDTVKLYVDGNSTVIGSSLPTSQTAQLEIIGGGLNANIISASTSPGGATLFSVSTTPARNPGDFLLQISSPNGAPVFGIQLSGHIVSSGTVPILNNCGTGPIILGSDMSGTVQGGTGATGCGVIFANTYATAPHCNVTARFGAMPSYVVTTTSITYTQASMETNKFDYNCNQTYSP